MSFDPRSDRSFYKQLADIFRDQILSGALAPGARLPSEHDTARIYGVGRETIRQAVAILRAEGLVITSRGAGTRVRDRVLRIPIRLGPKDRAVVRMPIDPERRRHDLAEGVPIIEIHRTDGTTEIHPGDSTELTNQV